MKTTYDLSISHIEGPRRVDSFLWSGVTAVDTKVPCCRTYLFPPSFIFFFTLQVFFELNTKARIRLTDPDD